MADDGVVELDFDEFVLLYYHGIDDPISQLI